jgi:hypothetical protein
MDGINQQKISFLVLQVLILILWVVVEITEEQHLLQLQDLLLQLWQNLRVDIPYSKTPKKSKWISY